MYSNIGKESDAKSEQVIGRKLNESEEDRISSDGRRELEYNLCQHRKLFENGTGDGRQR